MSKAYLSSPVKTSKNAEDSAQNSLKAFMYLRRGPSQFNDAGGPKADVRSGGPGEVKSWQ